jgi:hypothetical protein
MWLGRSVLLNQIETCVLVGVFCWIRQKHVAWLFNKTLLPSHMFLSDSTKHSYQATSFCLIQQNTPTKPHVSVWFNKTLLPRHMFLSDSTKHSYQATCFCLIQQNTPTKAHVSTWFNKTFLERHMFLSDSTNHSHQATVLLNQTETCGLVGVFCWIRQKHVSW